MVAACLAPQRFQSSESGPVLHQPLTTLTEDELAMKDTGKQICSALRNVQNIKAISINSKIILST